MTTDDELAGVVEAALADTGTPGCAVAISHRRRQWARGFGTANAETGVPFTPTTRIPICSMTKPYTAALVMALAERGQLDLDAPVVRYLADFRVADPSATRTATVRHLLQHTAGWVGDVIDQDAASPQDLDRGEHALAREVARMSAYRQVSPPGARWSYANSAYVVAGRIAEVLCGAPFEAALERFILAPLGMTQTTLFPELAITHPLAVGHRAAADSGVEVVRWPWNGYRRYAPAGCIVSTAADQLRWHRWWLGHHLDGAGRAPLTAAGRTRMLEETVRGGVFCDEVGLGWMIDRVDGGRVVHHGGSGWGVQTHGLFAPEADLALVILTNGHGGFGAIRRIRADVLERLAGIKEAPRPAPAPGPLLAGYAGAYRLLAAEGPERDEIMEVEPVGGGLALRLPASADGDRPPPIAAQVIAPDELVMLDGPLAGLRTEFLRASGDRDGEVDALRFGGRIWLRQRAADAS